MEYVPKNATVDPATRPRKLTEAEINDILAEIPTINGITHEATATANQSLRDSILPQLKSIKLSPVAIDEYTERLIRSFEESVVYADTAVGISAAEAFGRSATQTTLNTFHFAGMSKNVSSGLGGMQEVINVSRNRKNPSVTITFNDKHLSFLDIFRKKKDFVGITVDRVLKDEPVIDTVENVEQFWWHKVMPSITGVSIPDASYVLRLFLNINIMYQYRITIEKLAGIIQAGQGVICIYSPMPFIHDGKRMAIIDIYPKKTSIDAALIEKKLVNKSGVAIMEAPSLIFLEYIVRPAFKSMIIQGIPNITDFFPVESRVMRIVKSETKVISNDDIDLYPQHEYEELRRSWILTFNKLQMRLTGIVSANLEEVLALTNIKVTQITDDYISVVMPLAAGNTKPTDYMDKLIKEAEAEERQTYENSRREGIIIEPLNNKLLKASRFYSADTNGTNLEEILTHDDVDVTRTYSNDFYEMTRILGADSTRAFYIRDLHNVIHNSDAYVNPRHIELIASMVFNQGYPLGLTYSGISRQPVNYLSLASFQRTVDTLTSAALGGVSMKVNGISSALIVGKHVSVGTHGDIDIMPSPEYKALWDAEKAKFKDIDTQTLEDAIRDMDGGINFGGYDLNYTDEYEDTKANDETEEQIQILPVQDSNELPLGVASKGILNKGQPVMSAELASILKELSVAPAVNNADIVPRFKITSLRHGLSRNKTPAPVSVSSVMKPIEERTVNFITISDDTI